MCKSTSAARHRHSAESDELRASRRQSEPVKGLSVTLGHGGAVGLVHWLSGCTSKYTNVYIQSQDCTCFLGSRNSFVRSVPKSSVFPPATSSDRFLTGAALARAHR